jgi:hypothetical protein
MTTETTTLRDQLLAHSRSTKAHRIVLPAESPIPVDSVSLRALLRSLPSSWTAELTPTRLVLAWSVPGRRGQLSLAQLVTRSLVPALVSDVLAMLAYMGGDPTTRQVGRLPKEHQHALTRYVRVPWKYLQGYSIARVRDLIVACRNATVRG